MAIYELDDKKPNLPSKGNYWIAPNASVIGNVTLHEKASVWFNTVIRGDCAVSYTHLTLPTIRSV